MAVTQAWPIQRWIDRISERIVIESGGKVRRKNSLDRENPDLSQRGVLISRESTDLMVQGPCSTQDEDLLNDFSWLREILLENPSAKRIAIFPPCCGGDFQRYQAAFRRTFPEINFTFLLVSEMYDMPDEHADDLVRSAVGAGVVGIVKLD